MLLLLILLTGTASADYLTARQTYTQDVTLDQINNSIMAKIVDGRMRSDYPPRCIGNYTIINNKREHLEQWRDGGESAAMSSTHMFLVPNSIVDWRYYNIISFPTSSTTLQLLDEMEYYALEYAYSLGITNVSLFFHCHPHFSIPYLHLHIIDADHLGPSYEFYHNINTPLETVRSTIKKELKAG